ncbi:hypothetical protein JT05_07565 [Desulfosporosinus sp. Tol-M]|nr:hypothetical protein JT05_07565 [Desulfosporosinus sp. Tol-M]
MINQYYCSPQLPATPFSFSILVTSPIRRDLQFSPVSAMILPLASIKLHFASMIIVGLDMLMSFLFKRDLVHPPNLSRTISIHYPETLTLGQLNQLVHATIKGQVPMPSTVPSVSPVPGQGSGPVGGDEPLFPDNLSVSLFVSTSFASFDGSPDTSFTVPLFEVPGAPGNLLIALGLIIAQFLIERAGIGTPNGTGNGGNTHAFANSIQ